MEVLWFELAAAFPEVPNLPAKVEVEDAPAFLYDLKLKGVDVKAEAAALLSEYPRLRETIVNQLGLLK